MMLFNYFFTRGTQMIRFTNLGGMDYYISYRRNTKDYELMSISTQTTNLGKFHYVLDEKLKFQSKEAMRIKAKTLNDNYLYYVIKHETGLEIEFFTDRIDYLKFLSSN